MQARRRRPEQGLMETGQRDSGIYSHLFRRGAMGTQVFVLYLSPHCAHTLGILSSMRGILHRTLENHVTPKARPQRGRGQVSPSSASDPPGGLSPKDRHGHPGGSSAGAGQVVSGGTNSSTCPCPARVATVWPGCHQMATQGSWQPGHPWALNCLPESRRENTSQQPARPRLTDGYYY